VQGCCKELLADGRKKSKLLRKIVAGIRAKLSARQGQAIVCDLHLTTTYHDRKFDKRHHLPIHHLCVIELVLQAMLLLLDDINSTTL
jgi:hypothetical protein